MARFGSNKYLTHLQLKYAYVHTGVNLIHLFKILIIQFTDETHVLIAFILYFRNCLLSTILEKRTNKTKTTEQ